MNMDELVEAFGGTTSMAIAVGSSASGVSYWRKSGYIPKKRHDDVLVAAAEDKLTLKREDLIAMVERANPRPNGGIPTARAKSAEVLKLAAEGWHAVQIGPKVGISYSSVLRILHAARAK